LRYIPYLKNKKIKIKRFIREIHIAFRYKIELLESPTSKDAIEKLKHCYWQKKNVNQKSRIIGRPKVVLDTRGVGSRKSQTREKVRNQLM